MVDVVQSEPAAPVLPSKAVKGLGFKNAAVAQRTLQLLRGRDPYYQKMAVLGLLINARFLLKHTRKDRKISNIMQAIGILEQFIEDFDSRRALRQNNPYLSLTTVRKVEEMAGDNVTELQKSFIEAYSSVGGEYQRLRNVVSQSEDITWDIIRNRELKKLKKKYARAELFVGDEELSEEHMEMCLWAYSPERRRVWKCLYDPRPPRESDSQDGSRVEERRHSKRSAEKEKEISKIKEAMTTLEQSLQELKAQSSSRQLPYLSLATVRKVEELAGDSVTELQKSFISAYGEVRGEYKRLRTVRAQAEDCTWDVARNRQLKVLKEKYAGATLFTDEGQPTPEHIEMLLWAYSPEPERVEELHSEEQEERESDKTIRKRQKDRDSGATSGGKKRRSERIMNK